MKKEELSNYFTWVKAVWLNGRGQPLEFGDRQYLVGIYEDQFPNIVYTKSAQMGLSERLISEAVWLSDQTGNNVLYTFPAQSQLQDFVQARLNPVLSMSEYLRSRIDDPEGKEKKVEKLGLKRVGHGHIYFRGSSNAKQIISVDADCVILDERDRFNEENVPFIEKRLLASKLKWRREASTPTLPGMGIDLSYSKSDQRVWQIQCPKCHTWQEVDFFSHVDLKKKVCRCTNCKKPVNRLAPGRWFITNPKMTPKCHGYKINGMYNPAVTIEELVSRYKKARISGFSALQQFYNQDLGYPYEVSGQRLSITELDNCKRDYLLANGGKGFYAGVDVGVKHHHVVVVQKTDEDKFKIMWAGRVDDFFGPHNSVEAVVKQFDIKTLVIDKKPEVTKVNELMEAFPHRVFAAEYPPNVKFSIQDYFVYDDVRCEIRLDRTISLDYLISDIQNQRLELPKNIETVESFYDQLRSVTRVTEKNPKTGRDVARWIEKGADHFVHALNYARMAQIRGVVGKALLDYYRQPVPNSPASWLSWIKNNGQRLN